MTNDIQTMFDPKLNELKEIRGLLADIAGELDSIYKVLHESDMDYRLYARDAFNRMFAGCTPDDLQRLTIRRDNDDT